MHAIRTILLTLFATLACAITAAAEGELTVTSLTSSAQEGIVLTFSQDVKVKHSVFGTRCYTSFTDKDASIQSLNATPRTKGNVVTLEAAYCTFVNGHHMSITLNPECFTTLDGATTLSGDVTFDFIMGEGIAADPITALQVAPANGILTRIGNVSVIFSPSVNAIVDPAGYSVVNDKGHSLPVLSVSINTETSIASLNVDVDPTATLQEGTTYSLHIAPGAINCGGIVNDTELVYGRWNVRISPLTLVTTPADHRMVESLSRVTIAAADGQVLTCTDTQHPERIVITGIMEDASTVYATAKSIRPALDMKSYVVIFDNTITTASIANSTALYNSVKMTIPADFFEQGEHVNNQTDVLWKIEETPELGEVTWSFDPAPNDDLSSIGNPYTVEDNEGNSTELFAITMRVTGRNAYLILNDASQFRIVDAMGRTVRTFTRQSLYQQSTNVYVLSMEHAIENNGEYTLIIPSSCVAYHSDADHYSEPVHPLVDIETTWVVTHGLTTDIEGVSTTTDAPPATYDLLGRPQHSTTGSIVVSNGRKRLVK